MLADGRLPTGGHAHSGGLEEAVGRGAVADLDTLEAWLTGRLHTTGRVDAAFTAAAAGEAHEHGLGGGGDWTGLQAELAARLPSIATRRASLARGRGLLRVAASAWPAPWIPQIRAALPGGALWPVALGAVAAAAGLGVRDAALVAASAVVQGPAWAATRLLGLDPFAVAATLAGLAGAVDAVADEYGRLAPRLGSGDLAYVPELPACAAPLTDIGAEIHATWEVRLFAS